MITKGMKVVACEALAEIGIEAEIDSVPEYAIDAVITARAIVSNRDGIEATLNNRFSEILDTTVAVLKRRNTK